MFRSRRWAAIGLVVCLAGVLGGWWIWWREAPSPPPRFSIPTGLAGQQLGFAVDGRSYFDSRPEGTTAWDLTTGQPTWKTSGPYRTIFFQQVLTRDRRHFADWSVTDQALVWGDTTTEAIQGQLPIKLTNSHILPDLVWLDDHQVQFTLYDISLASRVVDVVTWDIAAGRSTRRSVQGPGPKYKLPLAYAPDGRTWIYYGQRRNEIQFWDSVTDQPIGQPVPLPSRPATTGVAATFADEGKTLILGLGNGRALFWDVAHRHAIKTLPILPGDHEIQNLQLSLDGRILATSGSIPRSRTTLGQFWDDLNRWISRQHKFQTTHQFVLTDLATEQRLGRYTQTSFHEFSPDSRHFATVDFKRAEILIHAVPQQSTSH